MTKSQKLKPNERKATANINFGQSRRERIRRYCASIEAKGHPRPTLPEAVNTLLDLALKIENL